jgi:hypothetical protein
MYFYYIFNKSLIPARIKWSAPEFPFLEYRCNIISQFFARNRISFFGNLCNVTWYEWSKSAQVGSSRFESVQVGLSRFKPLRAEPSRGPWSRLQTVLEPLICRVLPSLIYTDVICRNAKLCRNRIWSSDDPIIFQIHKYILIKNNVKNVNLTFFMHFNKKKALKILI